MLMAQSVDVIWTAVGQHLRRLRLLALFKGIAIDVTPPFIDLASCKSTAHALMVVPGPIASAQLVSKDPDTVMVVTRSGAVESGPAGGDHRTRFASLLTPPFRLPAS